MRFVESNFIKSAVYPKDYPSSEFTDIAFVGKSNVGKSSLINTLLNRKAIAKVSSTPGKTRLVNFFKIRFKIDETDEFGFLNFVDLPGYGYAKVSKTERAAWRKMVGTFFEERIQLRGVIFIVDVRHKADPKDAVMLQMLQNNNIPFLVVASKCDKIKKSQINKYLSPLQKAFELENNQITHFSSLKKIGIQKVTNWISNRIL
ncbi:MAG: YihA family ribosome biogenesis GTP-binding protein [Candidatus Cloacimonetes bacterium]|jgi:GTP-binding protein|nr:YihA family ribosome biogenesis GTP-binding protein [Candidatus Cloacimonadota bacterium]MBT6994346.1 YihA family ribosome biogenesis GTP-binding protein [Candidatus Cloacimonadota bacterium]